MRCPEKVTEKVTCWKATSSIEFLVLPFVLGMEREFWWYLVRKKLTSFQKNFDSRFAGHILDDLFSPVTVFLYPQFPMGCIAALDWGTISKGCCSSVVERVLGKDEVKGSTPFSSLELFPLLCWRGLQQMTGFYIRLMESVTTTCSRGAWRDG